MQGKCKFLTACCFWHYWCIHCSKL